LANQQCGSGHGDERTGNNDGNFPLGGCHFMRQMKYEMPDG
jgi:hypothetical protein